MSGALHTYSTWPSRYGINSNNFPTDDKHTAPPPYCCAHCDLRPPELCCCICHPEILESLFPLTVKDKQKRMPAACKTGPIDKDNQYYNLRKEVICWREKTIPLWEPDAPTTGLSAHTFMPPATVTRIADLATAGMVESAATLVHEKHTQIVDHSRHDTIPMWVKFDEKFDRSNLMKL